MTSKDEHPNHTATNFLFEHVNTLYSGKAFTFFEDEVIVTNNGFGGLMMDRDMPDREFPHDTGRYHFIVLYNAWFNNKLRRIHDSAVPGKYRSQLLLLL